MIRERIRQIYRRQISAGVQDYPEEDLLRSALIVAPHPDDETLGCGGAILKKCQAGATVYVALMTDGSKSHCFFMPPDELVATRKAELVEACKRLGVPAENVIFMDFEDGFLQVHFDKAVGAMTQLLQEVQPQEIFIPYHMDSHPDHVATNQIVQAAFAATTEVDSIFYEYPVWIWQHWPWVHMPLGLERYKLSILKRSLMAQFGLRMMSDFRLGMYIGDVKNEKRAALEEHRTQMSRFLPVEGWYTLEDVADGDWIDCFFQDYELYHRYTPQG